LDTGGVLAVGVRDAPLTLRFLKLRVMNGGLIAFLALVQATLIAAFPTERSRQQSWWLGSEVFPERFGDGFGQRAKV
jgi:hypothetical protein